MRLTEDQYELIEAYLTNELSDADRRSLETDLESDAELQNEVNRQRELRLGLRALGIQAALERARTQYNATLPADERNVNVKPLPTQPSMGVRSLANWRYWAAAASVVVVLGVGYFTYRQSGNHPTDLAYADTSVPGQADQLTKEFPTGTLSPASRQQVLDALANFKAGRYDAVIEQLNTLPADRQTIHYKNYFLGLSHLANKQPTVAIPLLQKALETPSVPLQQKAEWFLALAYVKNDQPEKALPTLKRISTDKAHPFQSLAQRVLEKID